MTKISRRMVETDPGEAGRTLQRILHDRLAVSNAEAKGLIASGCVLKNRRVVVKPDERAVTGDRIEIAFEVGKAYAGSGAGRISREGAGYRVIHEDDDLLIVDKEAGIVTIPAGAAAGDSLHERLLTSYRKRGHKKPQLWVVHRIDRFTSGLVVFARTHPSYLDLKAQFKARTPERIYLAIAEGRVERDRGRLAHALAENAKSLKVRVVPKGEVGRAASLSFRVLERFAAATLMEVTLETGRRNQIRVQFAAEGHPLIGDVAYGNPSALIPRVALHAHRLTLSAPRRPKRLRFESPLPEDLVRLLRRLRGAAHPEKRTSTPV